MTLRPGSKTRTRIVTVDAGKRTVPRAAFGRDGHVSSSFGRVRTSYETLSRARVVAALRAARDGPRLKVRAYRALDDPTDEWPEDEPVEW